MIPLRSAGRDYQLVEQDEAPGYSGAPNHAHLTKAQHEWLSLAGLGGNLPEFIRNHRVGARTKSVCRDLGYAEAPRAGRRLWVITPAGSVAVERHTSANQGQRRTSNNPA